MHICYGYGIQANIDWKQGLGREWRQYERIFPALAASRIDQVSLECANSHVPIELLGLLAGKDVLVGAIDVATDEAETPEQVAATIEAALRLRAARAAVSVHQLRHGAARPHAGEPEARGARRRRRAGARPLGYPAWSWRMMNREHGFSADRLSDSGPLTVHVLPRTGPRDHRRPEGAPRRKLRSG